MKKLLLIATVLTALAVQGQMKDTGKYVLVIHGGAGTVLQKNMTPEKEKAYKAGLQQALDAGSAILRKGGTALDAVEAAVKILEDNPLFNA